VGDVEGVLENEGINHILENISFLLYLVIPFNIDSATKHTCSEETQLNIQAEQDHVRCLTEALLRTSSNWAVNRIALQLGAKDSRRSLKLETR
jgi:hypothetical protein